MNVPIQCAAVAWLFCGALDCIAQEADVSQRSHQTGRTPAVSAAGASIDGDWAGSLSVGSYWVFIKARIRMKENSPSVLIDVPEEGVKSAPVGRLNVQSPKIRFEIQPAGWERTLFDGELGEGSISGTIEYAGEKGAFQLFRVVPASARIRGQYVGNYGAGSRNISITRYDPGDGQTVLTYFDSKSGYWGLLYAESESTFRFAPTRVSSSPTDLQIAFARDRAGKVTGLHQSQKNATSIFARKTSTHTEEQVGFQNGKVELAGTLLLPRSAGPHPAMVIVHGSGAQTRNGSPSSPNYSRIIAENFVRHGIAVLIYDKRGVGASTGDWNRASFDDLGNDALAGIGLLKSRSDINPQQIGFWGLSQAGWVMSSATSRSSDIAYVMLLGGGGVTPAEQELYRRVKNLREAGFSGAEIEEAVTHQKFKFDLVRRNKPESLATANEQAKNEKWFSYVSNPMSGESWLFWRNIINFDPLMFWEKFRRPILIVFGELDESSPVPKSVANLELALQKGGNKDYTIRVFPGANHGLLVKSNGNGGDYPHLAAGYLETMTEWLLKRVDVVK
ncbi:MAG: alpha/beta hydrolase [Anaerolineae bacterium]|nr:alpha/beta hydrolase [Gemmatimonadaceae bacterium]